MAARKGKSNQTHADRTDEAIDWLNSAGEDLLDAGADPEGLVEIAKDAVLDHWPNATFQDESILAAAQNLAEGLL